MTYFWFEDNAYKAPLPGWREKSGVTLLCTNDRRVRVSLWTKVKKGHIGPPQRPL